MRTLADVNVWIATLHAAHPHHDAAVEWWRSSVLPAGRSVVFCRLTQLGLVRLLSSERVMGQGRLPTDAAWDTYRRLLAQPPIGFMDEPPGTEASLEALTIGSPASTGIWTDAYLAALARAGGLRLATFDRGFRRFPGLELELLA